MSPSFSTFLFLTSILKLLSANFDCISRTSSLSNTGDDDKTFISCDATPYTTLVSCGCRPKNSAEANSDGCFVIDDKCYAQNGKSGQGMYAIARCCNFNDIPEFKCSAVDGQWYVPNSNGIQAVQCDTSSHIYLTGCSVSSPWKSFDGCYPGTTNPIIHPPLSDTDYPLNNLNNFCTVENGGTGGGSKAHAMCCDSPHYALNCVIRYGERTGVDQESYAKCADGYTMTGCSGYGAWKTVNSWYISDVTCIARSRNSEPIYAIAICCKLETDVPTTDPTESPTPRPTQFPTVSPTIHPTKVPTVHPTVSPTMEPTLNTTPDTGAAAKMFGTDNLIEPWFWVIVFVALCSLCFVVWLFFKRIKKNRKDEGVFRFGSTSESMELHQVLQRNVVNYTK